MSKIIDITDIQIDKHIERILNLSDEELFQEMKDKGENPEQIANDCRKIVENVMKKIEEELKQRKTIRIVK